LTEKADSKEPTLEGPPEKYESVDVDRCAPHPCVLGMRFEYDSESLEQNVKENGQLEPCRAVRSREDNYKLLVYVGQRRLNAVRALKKKFGIPSDLKVLIDLDDPPDEELVKRALAENIDDNGERLSLSDLEKISYCRSLLQKYSAPETEAILSASGLGRQASKKIILLVDKFSAQTIERLHGIETKSYFRFKFSHLDVLLASESEESLYATASLAAFSQKPPEEIKALRVGARHFVNNIPWFKDLFPAFEKLGSSEEHLVGPTMSEVGAEYDLQKPREPSRAPASDKPAAEPEYASPISEPFIIVLCPHCRSPNMFKLKTCSPEFIFFNLKPDGLIEQSAMEANTIFDCERECLSCQRPFWTTASILEGGRLVVETSDARLVKVPDHEASINQVYYDQREGAWMVHDSTSKRNYKLDAASDGPSLS
jgi:hypothetical protein